MRHTLFIHFVAVTAIMWVGCSKSTPSASTPAKAPAAEAGTATPAAAANAAQPAATEKAKGTDKAAPAEAAAPSKPAKADESDMVAEPKRKPDVTKADCDKACAHATKLSMASMPPDATPEMRAAIEKALTESCPKDCMAKGTKKLVSCILAAKNGMELAANCHN